MGFNGCFSVSLMHPIIVTRFGVETQNFASLRLVCRIVLMFPLTHIQNRIKQAGKFSFAGLFYCVCYVSLLLEEFEDFYKFL